MLINAYSYFDPALPVEAYYGHLPHWNQPGTPYFVTFRLADSLPRAKLTTWRKEREEWLQSHPEPRDEQTRREYYRRFPERLHRWLDAGSGSCLLKAEGNRIVVAAALAFFQGQRYRLDAWVIMPNHVHVIVIPFPDYPLFRIIQSWKAYTAKEINKRRGSNGRVWQRESYDHIIRNGTAHERIREYIRNNPKHIRKGMYTLWSEE